MKRSSPPIIVESACRVCGTPMWCVDPKVQPVCDQCMMEADQAFVLERDP